MENNSYLKLKNAEIGYSFKNLNFTGKSKLSSIRFYVSGMDLLTWSNAKLFDPENAGLSHVYPVMKIFNGGLSANF